MNIYLAGNDRAGFSVSAQAIGYPYRLCSYLYLRDDEKSRRIMLMLAEQAPHADWIMDSGLFTFMFGSGQGQLTTYADYEKYAVGYVAAMKAWGWKHAVVECDVQRVLGVRETHKLRDEVFVGSGLDVIYVWHIPEGEAGLVEMARRYKRIAISVPELRQVCGEHIGDRGAVKTAMLHCLKLIRSSGAEPRVHLLGNTTRTLIHAPAESCDSTSWISGGRFGTAYLYDARNRMIDDVSIYSPKWRTWRRWCESEFSASFQLMSKYFANANHEFYFGNHACSAIAFLMTMESIKRCDIRLPVPERLPERTDGTVIEEVDLAAVEA